MQISFALIRNLISINLKWVVQSSSTPSHYTPNPTSPPSFHTLTTDRIDALLDDEGERE